MKYLTTLITLLFCTVLFAQVGIGTSNPTAQLDINTSNSSLPPLELNPQAAPLGTAAGQMSVIGDQLYLFDNNRNKWLSVGSSTFNFGREGDLDGHSLEYAGDITNSGPSLPNNGTIVYVTLNSSGGKPDKGITLEVYDSADALVSSHSLNLSSGRLLKNDFDVDFNAGDYFRVRVDNDTGTNAKANDISAVLWTKWRMDNQ